MAYTTPNKTVTETYSVMTSATSGEALFMNRSTVPVRVALAASTPADTVLGLLLNSGDSFSRGAGTGHIYARIDRDGAASVTCGLLEDV